MGAERGGGALNHLGSFGRGGRYELYAGGAAGGLAMLQQASMALPSASDPPNGFDERLVKQL
jgi:hypothetical protein